LHYDFTQIELLKTNFVLGQGYFPSKLNLHSF